MAQKQNTINTDTTLNAAQSGHQLDNGAARQLGEWLTQDVARVAGWNTIIPKDRQHVATGQLTMLAKLFYDACVQFHATGQFPIDVNQYVERAGGAIREPYQDQDQQQGQGQGQGRELGQSMGDVRGNASP